MNNNPKVIVKAADIKALKPVVGKDLSRQIFTCICVSAACNVAILEATDSYKLARIERNTESAAENFDQDEKFLVPSTIFDIKMGKTDNVCIEFDREKKEASVKVLDKRYVQKSETILKLVEGNWVNTQRMFDNKDVKPIESIGVDPRYMIDIMNVFKAEFEIIAPKIEFTGEKKLIYLTAYGDHVVVKAVLTSVVL